MRGYISCFACGSNAFNIEGKSHPYMLASPGCWTMFGDIMNQEFSDLRYWKGHQFTVDAYAISHVGNKADQRAINSVHIHLAALYGVFEQGLAMTEVSKLRGRFSTYYKGKAVLEWLEPPPSFGPITIFDLWDNDQPELHYAIARNWAKSVWEAWSHQHDKVADLVTQIYT